MERRTYQGNVYTRNGPGEEWRLSGPAGGPPQAGQPIMVKPRNINEQRTKGAQATQEEVQASVDSATQGDAIRKAAADAQKAESDARNAALETQLKGLEIQLSEATGGMTPKDASERRMKQAQIQAFVNQINHVQGLLNQTVNQTSGIGGILDYLPSSEGASLDAAAAGLAEQGLAAFRVPGVGSQSDTELKQFVEANRPSRMSFDSANSERLKNLRNRVDETMKALGLESPQWTPENRSGQPQAMQQTVPRGTLQAKGAGGVIRDPALSGFASEIRDMALNGATADEMILREVQEMAKLGRPLSPDRENFYRELEALRSRTPDELSSFNWGSIENAYENPTEAGLLDGVGAGDLGTFGMNAANAVTGGNLANMLGGNSAEVMALANQNNPIAGFAGDVAGSFAPMSLLGKVGMLGRAGGLGADALYGGVRGFSEGEGGVNDRLVDALMGAGIAAGGNRAGNALLGGGATAIGGVADPNVRMLNDAGIAMTPGQIVGESGRLGGAVRSMENALESVPLVGPNITARRMEGVGDYGRAQLEANLAPIGYQPPAGPYSPDMLADAQQAVGDSYNFMNGLSFAPDQQFRDELTAAVGNGRNIPVVGDQFGFSYDRSIAPTIGGSQFSGSEAKDALQRLRGTGSNFATEGEMGSFARDATKDIESALLELMERQQPGVAGQLADANAAYAGLVPIEAASITAANKEARQFTPAQYGRSATTNTKKFGGRAAAARGAIPGAELQEAAQAVLPSSVPNSGTADRMMAASMLPAALGGSAAASAALIDPVTAALLASLAAGTTRTGQDAIQAALVSRPEVLRTAADKLREYETLAGRLGSSAAIAGSY